MNQNTPDLCDEFPDIVKVMHVSFRNYGQRESFSGPARTVKCFEDNSKVKDLAAQSGDGCVIVVDGGASMRHALLGDMVAAQLSANGWAGLVIYGAVRDVEALREIDLGVKALGSVPLKTDKRDLGDIDVPVEIGGVRVMPGDHVFADATGVVVMPGSRS
ncbi:MAG: ribonuclease E activity regulator RraA [Micrococcales bacterium]|nr:ribonuclease E activity regulator RraA [Micrococcales bacterium]